MLPKIILIMSLVSLPPNRAFVCLLAVTASLLPAKSATVTNQPTQHEQYMLQIINRTRADGNAEMTRLSSGITITEGPPRVGSNNWTIYNNVQPVAWNTQLAASAQSHANNLQNVDWIANQGTYGSIPHTPTAAFPGGATTPASRIAAAGYVAPTSGYRNVSGLRPGPENIYVSVASPSNGWSLPETLAVFDAGHKNLFEDKTYLGRGHRNTTMYEEFREVGFGTALGTDNHSGIKDTAYLVQNFGKSSVVTDYFLTGLAYNDLDSNNFFTPERTGGSETIPGLTVQARQSGVTVASVAAFDTGGYSLPLAAGSYQIFSSKPMARPTRQARW